MDPAAPNENPAPEDDGFEEIAGVDDAGAAPPAAPKANVEPPDVDGAGAADAPNANAGAGVALAPAAGAVAGAGAVAPKPNDGAAGAGAAPPAGKAKLVVLEDVLLVGAPPAAGVDPAPNENPTAPGAAGVAPLPAGTDNDGVDPSLPNENIVFLVDGSDEATSVFFSDVGGAPNANPAMDAPPLSVLPAAGVGAAPNANPPAVLVLSSFFSSPPDAPAPKVKPADVDALAVDAGAEAAPAPKLKPADGAAPWLVDASLLESSSSRPRLDLAGVFPGVATGGPPNENPPAPILPPLLDDGAADPPNENPPAPILPALSSPASSRPRFALAGVAPALALLACSSFLGVSQEAHLATSPEFLQAHVLHFHSPGFSLNMSLSWVGLC